MYLGDPCVKYYFAHYFRKGNIPPPSLDTIVTGESVRDPYDTLFKRHSCALEKVADLINFSCGYNLQSCF